MRKLLHRLVTKNLRYKLFAFLLAVAIWYSVTERSFEDVPISPVQPRFVHPENIAVSLEQVEPVFIKLNCPDYLHRDYNLSAESFWIRILLDPSVISEQRLIAADNYSLEIDVPLTKDMVKAELPEHFKQLVYVESITPSHLEVPVSLITKMVPIEPQAKGKPAEGYIAREPILSHNDIALTGSREALDKVDSIPLQAIDLTGLKKDAQTKVEIPKSLLQEQYNVRALRDADRRVWVTVPIEQEINQRVLTGIRVELRNQPPGTNVSYSPVTVEIVVEGKPAILRQIEPDLLSAEVDLQNYGSGKHRAGYTIRGIPQGLNLVQRSVDAIEVEITTPIPDNNTPENTAIPQDGF